MNKFAIVPNEAISDPLLTPSEFKVLVALYSFRDKNCDTVWPNLESLAARAGYKDKTQVSKITTRLEAKYWLNKSKKKFFNGPKKYKLNIPDRLLIPESIPEVTTPRTGEAPQLGKNAQLGEPQHGENAQLGKNAQLGENEPPNLERMPNSILGTYPKTEQTIEHTKEQTNSESLRNDSAARAAKPVDNSFSSLGNDYQSQSAEKLIFDRGVHFLGQYGIENQKARSFLGMLKTDVGPGRALDAVIVSILSQPAGNPKAFMLGVVSNQPKPMTNDWTPSEATVAELAGLKVPDKLISEARDVFVIWFMEMEIQHSDWPRLFKDWCIRELEAADFQAFEFKRRLAASAGLNYQKPFMEPPGGTL